MLQNAYLLAKIGADTAENERKFAEHLPKIGNYPAGSTVDRLRVGARAQAGVAIRAIAAVKGATIVLGYGSGEVHN